MQALVKDNNNSWVGDIYACASASDSRGSKDIYRQYSTHCSTFICAVRVSTDNYRDLADYYVLLLCSRRKKQTMQLVMRGSLFFVHAVQSTSLVISLTFTFRVRIIGYSQVCSDVHTVKAHHTAHTPRRTSRYFLSSQSC